MNLTDQTKGMQVMTELSKETATRIINALAGVDFMPDVGLKALMTDGLMLKEFDDGITMVELLQWTRATPTTMPAADMSVLVQYADFLDRIPDICNAWWDGQVWRECATGGELGCDVLWWADPKGPQP